MSESTDLPFWLRGNFAPVTEEVTDLDLKVEGSIPPQLQGLYLRNGPNPQSGTSAHWFLGDGMIHGVRLEEGRAAWYRNRYVRGRAFEDPDAQFVDEEGNVDLEIGGANTNIIGHAGRILALVEIAYPTELTGELDTIGPCDFDGRLKTGFTAHPKPCAKTGELHFFSYSFKPPFLTYHVLDRDGKLVKTEEIDVPGPTMMHDFAITDRHVIFMDLPVVFRPEQLGETMPYGWSDEYGARIGVMPRGGNNAGVRWFEIDPCYIFHPFNAYEDGTSVVMDAARYPQLWGGDPGSFDAAKAHRFRVDLESEKVTEQPLDDRPIEFPRVDDRLTGLPHRYGYAVQNVASVGDKATQVVKYDLETGGSEVHDFGATRSPAEAVFVPASDDAAEDEGFLMTYVYDEERNGSDFVVLNAQDFSGDPVATVRLPQRVPFGFHGNWVPDRA